MPGEWQKRFTRSERRIAIMAVARAVWIDPSGAARESPARLEDTSRSGACIRISVPISIDTKLFVDWREERFSGIARYCRADAGEYSVGIRRDFPEGTVAATLPAATVVANTSPGNIDAPTSEQAAELEAGPPRIAAPLPLVSTAPKPAEERQRMLVEGIHPESAPREQVPRVQERTAEGKVALHEPQLRRIAVLAPRELQTNRLPRHRERTNMLSKLFGSKQDVKNDSNGGPNGAAGSNHGLPANTQRSNDSRPRATGQEPAGPQGNLLPLEDIYRAAGLIDLRTGYNIQKVVEMLNSGHIRNLSEDMRRASILMALDAADIPVENILRDARLRLEALSRYESDQQKRLQEYEAQKLEENAEIQTELEKMTEHYKARMKGNLDDVTRLRDPFVSWQATKQEEVQRVSEAVALCSKRAETGVPAERRAGATSETGPTPATPAASPQPAMKV